jgi:hypothetical protein
VDFGGEPAARPADVLRAAAPGTASEALRLGDCRIHHHGLKLIPRDAALEQLIPDALLAPAPEAAIG